ncbi:MAG TPA: tetratricopeptide repeat protein [Pyrinomonadaceae bacterium]|nr:tetratricopeptide repeat protein [Pyrinomonadaceae bacterium]
MFPRNFLNTAACCALVLFCLSILCQPLAAQSGQDVPKLKQQASELIKQQKYTEALPILEKLAAAEPDNADTQLYLGFALIAQANTMKDEADRKAIRIRARNAFLKAKELGNTEPVLDAMIQSTPPDGSEGKRFSENAEADKLMMEAEAAFSQGKLDDALKMYQRAYQLDPKLYEAALFSGDVYTQRGDYAQAEIWYQKAIAIDPNRETAYRYSATPLMKQGKHDQARDRYIEAHISEPYNRFTVSGLSQWAQVTNTELAHPEIEIPVKVSFDDKGDAKIEMAPNALAGGKDDGSFAWVSYGATRSAWHKEKFAKTFPQEKTYRHSLAEEADALRSVLALATGDGKVKNLSPSLARLKKLSDEGLLEAYILLARADEGIAQDHPAYLKQNRDKLRRYFVEYVLGGAGPSQGSEQAKAENNSDIRARIEKEYDRAKDQTTLKLGATPITCVTGACIFLSLHSSFPGTSPKAAPERFVIALYFFTKDIEPFTDLKLVASIDGQTIEIGTTTFAGKDSKDGVTGMAYGIVLNRTVMEMLAKARRVEMRLGGVQFAFGENGVAVFREFYRQATPGQ